MKTSTPHSAFSRVRSHHAACSPFFTLGACLLLFATSVCEASPTAWTATGEEAIAYCDSHRPDRVIMDVKMPGRGGLFASGEITTRHPGTRIVVMSQYDDELMADGARAAGAIDFISKDRIAELPEILLGLDVNHP